MYCLWQNNVCKIIRSFAQTCHALRLLRSHGMANASLQVVCRAITSLEQSSPPSWHALRVRGGADRQRLEAIIRRGKRTDLCSEDHPTLAKLVERADDELFDKVSTLDMSCIVVCTLLNVNWYELHGIDDTRDTCAVSRYFVLKRYTAVYRDLVERTSKQLTVKSCPVDEASTEQYMWKETFV